MFATGDDIVKSQTETTDGGDHYVISKDEQNYLENFPEEVTEVTTPTPPEFPISSEKGITTLKQTRSNSSNRTHRGTNGLAINHSLFYIIKMKKNNTGVLSDTLSSGEPDESDLQAAELEKKDSYPEGNSTVQNDDDENYDELLEVEELIAVPDSNKSRSGPNILDSLFSSGEPDEEATPSEQNITNEGGPNPLNHLTQNQPSESNYNTNDSTVSEKESNQQNRRSD